MQRVFDEARLVLSLYRWSIDERAGGSTLRALLYGF